MERSAECLRASQLRYYFKTGEWFTDEDFVMSVIPEDSDIKREEIFQMIAVKYGKIYDNTGVHSVVTAALRNLCKTGTIVKVGHGIYARAR